MQCLDCKQENSPENNFCSHCGNKLHGNHTSPGWLRLIHGEPTCSLFTLKKMGRTTIGHDCGNSIVLGDQHISNKHAVIIYEDDCYWIADRGSKNGVFINDSRISERTRLEDGSLVRLGTTVLKFETRRDARKS